jgi:thiosulfate dehydrogenase
MGKFIVGIGVGALLVPLGFYLYVRSGRAPVATAAPPLPLEKFFVKTALHATIDREASKTVAAPRGEAALMAGAQTYQQHCAVCHGLPTRPPTPEATGMYPPPPQFFRPGAKPIDDPFWEVFWKIKNGIRLTGMPGFHASLTNQRISQVGALLETATHLPASVSHALETRPQGGSQSK